MLHLIICSLDKYGYVENIKSKPFAATMILLLKWLIWTCSNQGNIILNSNNFFEGPILTDKTL